MTKGTGFRCWIFFFFNLASLQSIFCFFLLRRRYFLFAPSLCHRWLYNVGSVCIIPAKRKRPDVSRDGESRCPDFSIRLMVAKDQGGPVFAPLSQCHLFIHVYICIYTLRIWYNGACMHITHIYICEQTLKKDMRFFFLSPVGRY